MADAAGQRGVINLIREVSVDTANVCRRLNYSAGYTAASLPNPLLLSAYSASDVQTVVRVFFLIHVYSVFRPHLVMSRLSMGQSGVAMRQ